MTPPPRDGNDDSAPSAFVFAPTPLLTVTVESSPSDVPELHVHAGGQGFWIARMAVTLGLNVRLCGTFGGETGPVVSDLIAREGVSVRAVFTAGQNGSYVHDRRGGERKEIVEVPPPTLNRHEADDLFGAALSEGLDADVALLGGPHCDQAIPHDVYTRLAADLTAMNVPVVADLSGPTMTAALEGGLAVLKVSHEDLIEDGRAKSDDVDDLIAAMKELVAQGARNVVLSRAGDPALALVDDELMEIVSPPLNIADHRGAGDSMTAGIGAALAAGRTLTEALRLGAAAGAVNVTRHGLATGQRELVAKVAESVEVRPFAKGKKGR